MTFLTELVQGAKKQNLDVELTNRTKVENVAGAKRKVDKFSLREAPWKDSRHPI